MRVRVTWADGSKTEEDMLQEYRAPGEMEMREDYYIVVSFRGNSTKINIAQNCLETERI